MIRLCIVGVCAAGAVLSAYTLGCAVLVTLGTKMGASVHWWLPGWPRRNLTGRRRLRDVTGVYVHWFGPLPLYVGQTIDGGSRMIAHGKDIRCLFWTHCTFLDCHRDDFNVLERDLIRVYPWVRFLGFNQTDGGS